MSPPTMSDSIASSPVLGSNEQQIPLLMQEELRPSAGFDQSQIVSYGKVLDFLLQTKVIIAIAIVERIITFLVGWYQDTHMELRFTDIDYFVFTDASRFMSQGESPYERETYRYTPLLAWLLLPTVWWFFSFGKLLFAIGDILSGYLIIQILQMSQVPENLAVIYSAVWLINPMVGAISTRGSSEGLIGAMVILFVWAAYAKRYILSGILAGVAVHFKIYPIIYVPTVLWALDNGVPLFGGDKAKAGIINRFCNRDRLKFGIAAAASFLVLTGAMYAIYGYPFLLHTYLHHLSRIDHRHNFSPYSTLLYISSSPPAQNHQAVVSFLGLDIPVPMPSAWAFLPQLSLSAIILPLAFAKRDIAKTMFVQTFAFVTFNKVCTAQYFMWYMVLLPFFLPSLGLASKGKKSFIWLVAVFLWVGAQAFWIKQAYSLEWLGKPTFYPGLFSATMFFFAVNCWGLGLFIQEL